MSFRNLRCRFDSYWGHKSEPKPNPCAILTNMTQSETPDMFLHDAQTRLEVSFAELSPLEQVRVLRQLMIDLGIRDETHWTNIFQFADYPESVEIWLDELQESTPHNATPAETSQPDYERAEKLKTQYESIREILLAGSIDFIMRWKLYSQLLEHYVTNLQTIGLSPDEVNSYLRDLKREKILAP